MTLTVVKKGPFLTLDGKVHFRPHISANPKPLCSVAEILDLNEEKESFKHHS